MASEILKSMGEHPILAWSALWGIWPLAWLIYSLFIIPFNFIFKMRNRSLRARNIRQHGWPTMPFMDADGDIVHPPVKEAKTNG